MGALLSGRRIRLTGRLRIAAAVLVSLGTTCVGGSSSPDTALMLYQDVPVAVGIGTGIWMTQLLSEAGLAARPAALAGMVLVPAATGQAEFLWRLAYYLYRGTDIEAEIQGVQTPPADASGVSGTKKSPDGSKSR